MLLPPAGYQLAELVVVQAVLDLDDAARLSRVQEDVPVVLGRQSVRVELDADRLKRSEPPIGVARVGAAEVDDLIAQQSAAERRVGQECVESVKTRWLPGHQRKNT